MGLFRRRPTVPETIQRNSCSGCSTCFSKPIESLTPAIRDKLELVRGALVESRNLYLKNDLSATTKAREVKLLVGELRSLGDFSKEIDRMFAAHVPETDIQQFIVRT